MMIGISLTYTLPTRSVFNLMAKKAEMTSSTLVVCNHVPTAHKVYKALKPKINDTVLLHSRSEMSMVELLRMLSDVYEEKEKEK